MIITEIENDFQALKTAYQQGCTIQAWRTYPGGWVDLKKPNWSPRTQYRIKPGALGLASEQLRRLEKKSVVAVWFYIVAFAAGVICGLLLGAL